MKSDADALAEAFGLLSSALLSGHGTDVWRRSVVAFMDRESVPIGTTGDMRHRPQENAASSKVVQVAVTHETDDDYARLVALDDRGGLWGLTLHHGVTQWLPIEGPKL